MHRSFYQLITLTADTLVMRATYADVGWFLICIMFLILPVMLVFSLLEGKTNRRRAFPFSLLRFYVQTFNINT